MNRSRFQTRLSLQVLESRLVPTAKVSNGWLKIEGTDVRDSVVVYQKMDRQMGEIFLVYETIAGRPRSAPLKFKTSTVSPVTGGIQFNAYGGNDSFHYSNLTTKPGYRVGANGGTGNDDLHGGTKDDLLSGEEGNDILEGEGGDDTLQGGGGADRIWGGAGNDELYGDEWLGFHSSGPDGRDILYGEAGNDRLEGGGDGFKDQLLGGKGADTFVAETRYDEVYVLEFYNLDKPVDFKPAEGDKIVNEAGDPWLGF